MPRFINDDLFYLRVMRDFIEENEIQKVKDCLCEKNYELALNYAFDVKALSGSLGLSNTYELAQHLCVSIKELKLEDAWEDISNIQSYYLKLQNLKWINEEE